MTKNFKVAVNSSWCKGCNLCVQICPKKVLDLNERLNAFPAREKDCIGCRQCENICPDLAITILESKKGDGQQDE